MATTVTGTVEVSNTPAVTLGAALPAGTNNIGDVDIASIAAGNNNIGDVDVASIAAGDNNIGNVDIASAIPAGANVIGATQFVDESGVAYGVKHINNKPRVSSMPYLYDMAEGNVPNHVGWSKLGYNGDVGTSQEDLWAVGGLYVFPAAAIQMQVVSSSANDTAAGTGVRTVVISYLDASYVTKSETVTLNGVGAVTTTATDIFRVQRFRAGSVGSGGMAAGNISLQAVGGGVTYSQIATGYTRARNITYTVPAGKALYITSITFSNGSLKGVRFTTRATYDADAAAVTDFFLPYTEVAMEGGAFYRPLEIPTAFPAQVSLKVSAVADAAGAVCAVALRGWLEDA